jgi:hypothetical protein
MVPYSASVHRGHGLFGHTELSREPHPVMRAQLRPSAVMSAWLFSSMASDKPPGRPAMSAASNAPESFRRFPDLRWFEKGLSLKFQSR